MIAHERDGTCGLALTAAAHQPGRDGADGFGGGLKSADQLVDVCGVQVDGPSALLSLQPETCVAHFGVDYFGDRRMGQQIAIFGCSPNELNGILDFINVNAGLLAARGCEALCSIFDEIQPASQSRCGSKNLCADVIVAVYQTEEQPLQTEFDLLEFRHCAADSLPKDFARLFSEAVDLVSHDRKVEQPIPLSQWEEEWSPDLERELDHV